MSCESSFGHRKVKGPGMDSMSGEKVNGGEGNAREGQSADQSIGQSVGKPTAAQLRYLRLGLNQPGGKLPLFDGEGQEINPKTIRSCVARGWAEPWFDNPAMPNWLVCKLTAEGRDVAKSG